MYKRHRDSTSSLRDPTVLKDGDRPIREDEVALDFEDEFEDEFESEDEVFEAGVDGRPDAEREAEEAEAEAMDVDPGMFIPGRTKLEPGQTLEPNLSTYQALHRFSSKWSCLSVDIVKDHLGDNRSTYPATLYAVAGTQAARGREQENELVILKLSSLSKIEQQDEGSESDEEDDEEEDSEPILESKSIPLTSCTNRIRVHQRPRESGQGFATTHAASMMESGQVLIHDVTPHLTAFDTPGSAISPDQNKPTILTHHRSTEGYALDWSPLTHEGKLLTGDSQGRIFHTISTPAGAWELDRRDAFQGHAGSIEDLQWSPSEGPVFASGSSDGTVKIWDTRSKSRKAKLSVRVSNTDVNVLSWSRLTTHLLASGHDDGSWAVWDLRQWRPAGGAGTATKTPESIASFHFNKEQITCLEWHPTDDSIIMAAAGDDSVTLWDLAVEIDDEESKETGGVKDWPPQLLFSHWQEGVKEGHWHPQIPGLVVSTGLGFDVFKTISV